VGSRWHNPVNSQRISLQVTGNQLIIAYAATAGLAGGQDGQER
jgi:hypothetical protein